MMLVKKNLDVKSILLSLVGFILLWAIVTDAWGYSALLPIRFGSYVYAFISRLIWVAPAFWLIFRYSDSLVYNRKSLFSKPLWNRPFIITLIASLVFVLACMFLNHVGFWLNPVVNIPLETMKIIMVGLVEETVLRGWGYNALLIVTSDQKAVLYSTIFFVLLHWPAYFVRLFRFGTMDVLGLLGQSIAAMIWGILFCWLLKKGKTLWHPIIIHIVYDLCIVLFVG